MKMYVLEDKKSEQDKAIIAITSAGHEVTPTGYVMGLLSYNVYAAEVGYRRSCVGELIINAVDLAKEEGAGIITDMMFQTSPCANKDDPLPPGGLLVLIHALANGVPVVVCTDAAEVGGHHAKALSWIYDGYVNRAQREGVLPFGWVEDKDWDKAVALLAQMMSGDPGE